MTDARSTARYVDSPMGLPQVLTCSGQTLPTILGLREFAADSCVLCTTGSAYDDATRRVLERFEIEILNPSRPFELSDVDPSGNRSVVEELRNFIETSPLCSSGVMWNYTGGTKPMAIALDRYMAAGESDSAVRGMFYVDTRRAAAVRNSSSDGLRIAPNPGTRCGSTATCLGCRWAAATR